MAVSRLLWVDRASGTVTRRDEADLPALLVDPSGGAGRGLDREPHLLTNPRKL